MRKYLAILAAAGALSCWSVAQTQNAEEKHERAAQKVQDNDNSNPNGNMAIVSGPSVSTTGNSANITWSTSGRAATIVHYGTDPNNLSQKSHQPGGAREHNVTLSNLQPNATYYFAIMTDDGTVRTKGQFQTQANGAQKAQDNDNNNPNGNITITNGPSVSTTGNSANITWGTSGLAATIVQYGTDPNNLSQKSYQPGGSREHNVTLSNLQPGATYYFALMTDDGTVRTKGQFQTHANGTASTASATSPINSSQIQKEPLYRLSSAKDRLYTTSSAEKNQAQALGYKYDGIAGYISANQAPGTQPLYRLVSNGTSPEHFYTSSQAEMQNAVQNLHFRSEGVIGYVSATQIPGTIALERLVQPSTGEYLFTTSAAEKSSAVGQYKYQDQGVCCYLWPS